MIIFKTWKTRSDLITTLSVMLSSPAVVSIFIELHVLKEMKLKSEDSRGIFLSSEIGLQVNYFVYDITGLPTIFLRQFQSTKKQSM